MKFNSNRIVNLFLVLLIAVNTGMAVSYPILWVQAGQQGLLWRADFTAYYTALTIVKNGQGSRLYDLNLQESTQQSLIYPNIFKDGLLPFNYPPYVSLVLYPLKAFPLQQAYLVFALVQLALLAGLITSLFRLSQHWSLSERLGLVLVILAHPSLFLTLILGSFTLVVFYSLAQFYTGLVRPSRLSGGIWLLPATFKLQNVIVPVLVLLGSRNKRAIMEACLFGIMLAAVTTLILGWNIWLDYARLILQISGLFDQFGIVAPDMYNLKGALALLFGESAFRTINWINTLLFFVSSLLILVIFNTNRIGGKASFPLKFSFAMTLGLILSPHHNPQDSLLILLPLFLFYDYLRGDLPRQRILTWIILFISPLQLLIDIILKGRLPFHLPFIVMLGLSFWIGWELLKNYQNTAKESV